MTKGLTGALLEVIRQVHVDRHKKLLHKLGLRPDAESFVLIIVISAEDDHALTTSEQTAQRLCAEIDITSPRHSMGSASTSGKTA